MSQRLSWSSLKEAFKGQWVEIIDYQWDSRSPHPEWARVRRHAPDRNELLTLVHEAGRSGRKDAPLEEGAGGGLPPHASSESIILFVGAADAIIEGGERTSSI